MIHAHSWPPRDAARPFKLYIGNRSYSSWSLRPWLVMRHFGFPLEEERVLLGRPDSKSRLLAISASGRVPVLVDEDLRVWDSLAIIEHLAERFPGAAVWPAAARARSEARSVSAEMHAGFGALRTQMPFNCRAHGRIVSLDAAARGDIERICALWSDLRSRHASAGPWLFGDFSAVDAMYAPVALRFVTYGVPLEEPAAGFVRSVRGHPAVREWLEAAREEEEVIEEDEVGSQ